MRLGVVEGSDIGIAWEKVSASMAVLCQGVDVSSDVFLQGFIAGESSGAGGAQMRGVLAPHVVERRGAFLRVKVGDGEADIYFDDDDGMMANHISGRDRAHSFVVRA